MPERRGSRFLLEVLFLLALMGALMLTELGPLPIAGVMLLGWVIAAAFEWAASRGEAHYGSGLPPRYYVPQVSLPPRRPLEQVGGYPEQRDEAPTWIASAAMRDELLGEWPVAAYADPDGATESEEAAPDDVEPDEPDVVPESVPEAAVGDPPVAPSAPPETAGEEPADAGVPPAAAGEEPDTAEDAVAAVDVAAAEQAAGRPDEHENQEPADQEPADQEPEEEGRRQRRSFWQRHQPRDADPWLVTELPGEPLGPPDPSEAVVLPAATVPEPDLSLEVQLVAAPTGARARHSLDPLAEPERGRRAWQRSAEPDTLAIEVPARPPRVRRLPARPAAVRSAGED